MSRSVSRRSRTVVPRKRAAQVKPLARKRQPRSAQHEIDLSLLPELIGYNLRRAQIGLRRHFVRTIGKSGMRPGLFSLLVLAEANPGIAQIELANELDIDKATVVALIDRLERQGWVERRRSTEDRRRHGIFLTPEGARGLRALKRDIVTHEKRFAQRFTAAELRRLLELLERCHD